MGDGKKGSGDCRLMRVLNRKESDDEEDELYKKYGAGSRASEGWGVKMEGKKKSNKDRSHEKKKPGLTGASKLDMVDSSVDVKYVKKKNFVNLHSLEGSQLAGQVIHLPGRHRCDCQARQHQLINNCLGCGRVVCTQEGSGPCFFCGELVCTNEEEEIINKGTKRGRELKMKLMAEIATGHDASVPSAGESNSLSNISAGLTKAIQAKEKLLSFDKDTVRRTKVIDDQMDFFKMGENQWMSKEERLVARKLEEEERERLRMPRSKMSHKITLDLKDKKAFEEKTEDLSLEEQEAVYESLVERTRRALYTGSDLDNEDVFVAENSSIARGNVELVAGSGEYYVPELIEDECLTRSNNIGSMRNEMGGGGGEGRRVNRVQDRDGYLSVKNDQGMCLSMHQPYASHLVRGIKKHEGRTWYSHHRGMLWIAATSKICPADEKKELENFYINYYGGSENLPCSFPKTYPSGCILGCVSVIDCLPQEEYREKYPNGESLSPYVFICEYPRELPVKLPLRGQHKIYKLDMNLHQAAKKLILAPVQSEEV